jgi:hypothetical protein
MATKWADRLAALKAQGVKTVYPAADRDGWTIHHSVGGAKTAPLAYARQVADMHWAAWQRPGGYNFMVATNGTIYEMCGFTGQGAHAGTNFWNRATLGLCFQGDYRTVTPADVMVETATGIIHTSPAPTRQWTHKEVRPEPTSCPGQKLIALLPLEDTMTPAQEAKLDAVLAAVNGVPKAVLGTEWTEEGISPTGKISVLSAVVKGYKNSVAIRDLVGALDAEGVTEAELDAVADRIIASVPDEVLARLKAKL